MLEFLLAPLLSLTPQDPAGAAGSSQAAPQQRAAAPDRWLPGSTLVALTVQPVARGSAIEELLATDEARALRSVAGRLLDRTGIAGDELAAALDRGLALGLLSLDATGQPDLLLVADVGAAGASLAARLGERPTAGDGLWTLNLGTQRVFVGLEEGHLALGTVARSVTDGLARTRGSWDEVLADDPDFQRSLPSGDGARLAHLFLRPSRLLGALVDGLPDEPAAIARKVSRMLGVDDMAWGGATWQLDRGDLLAVYQLASPRGFSLFDALAGTTGRLDAGLARYVPAEATGYGFFAVEFGNCFDEALAIASSAQPALGAMIDQSLRRLRDQTGIDVRADVIGGLAGRVLSTNFADGQFGALVELRQGTSFDRALRKLVPLLPVPMRSGTCAGAPCWRAPADGDVAPAFAVAGNWFAFASSDAALARIVRQIQAPKADAAVLSFLRTLPPDTSWASHGPAAELPGPWFEDLRASLRDTGQRTMFVRRTEQAFVTEERVGARDLLRIAAGVADVAMERLGAPAGGPPRQPTATAPRRDPAPASTGGSDPVAVATLQQAETDGPSRSGKVALAALLSHAEPAIVARAAWMLGQWQATESAQMLGTVANEHPSADVRLQALAALAGMASNVAVAALSRATEDDDRRVRTVAVQALGRLGSAAAAAPALALLDRFGSTEPQEAPTDLVAALVVLHDLGNSGNLLPAASSIGFSHSQVGQALAFLFQGLSPRLDAGEEVKMLLAVIDHPEPMLRRYAIQRLGELRDPVAVRALEGRLAVEGPDLQPLVRVSLSQVRGDVEPAEDDLIARAKSNVTAISQMVERRWTSLDQTGQIAVIALGGLVVLGLLVLLVARRRARRNRAAATAAALVEPSVHYHEEEWAEPEAEEWTAEDEMAEVGHSREERF